MKAIIIIGAARSGTKMLGHIFSLYENVQYFGEVNYFWKTGSQRLNHDAVTLNDVNIDMIRNKFIKKIDDDKIIVEKTAANCLRMDVVQSVFDEAKFVHIVRDGRDVALSAANKWKGKHSSFETKHLHYKNENRKVFERIQKRINEMTFKEVLNVIPKGVRYLLTFAGIKKETTWGPIMPGLLDIRKNYSLIETCAYQWKASEESVLNYMLVNNNDNFITVKYEDIQLNPEKYLTEIFEFCNLGMPTNFDDMVSVVKKGNIGKWKSELPSDETHKIEYICASLLNYYGYK